MENCIDLTAKRPLPEAFEDTFGFPPSSDELQETIMQLQLYDLRPEELDNFSEFTKGLIAAGFDSSNTCY